MDFYSKLDSIFEATMLKGAYWISPKGEIIDVPNLHIDVVIQNPEKFGITKDIIQQIFDKHNEHMGVDEGFAREEIMLELLKKGWIRLRFLPKNYTWTVQTFKLGKREQDAIFTGFAQLVKSRIVSRSHGVKILTDKETKFGEVDDIIKYTIFEGKKPTEPSLVCHYAKIKNLPDLPLNENFLKMLP
jgi:hypothetical protein